MSTWKAAFIVVCTFIGVLPLLYLVDDNPAWLLWVLWFFPLMSAARE